MIYSLDIIKYIHINLSLFYTCRYLKIKFICFNVLNFIYLKNKEKKIKLQGIYIY